MTISVEPVHPLFVGRVRGVDLRRPVDAATIAAIEQAIFRYAVLIFPDQPLDDAQQIAFSGLLGPLEGPAKRVLRGTTPRIERPEIADVSNLDETNAIMAADDRRRLYNLGNQLWHTDASFRAIPATYSLLSARVVPPTGGETEFADMRAAWDALPAELQRQIDGRVAEHSIWYSRGLVGAFAVHEEERQAFPPVPQRLVRTHPGSKRRALYIASHASHVIGMDPAEGRALLDRLMAHATQPQFVYRHHWSVGELVMWDNRCTMHRGRPYDDVNHRRAMHRTTVRDTVSSLEEATAA